jgi:hypothetical protein
LQYELVLHDLLLDDLLPLLPFLAWAVAGANTMARPNAKTRLKAIFAERFMTQFLLREAFLERWADDIVRFIYPRERAAEADVTRVSAKSRNGPAIGGEIQGKGRGQSIVAQAVAAIGP